MCVGLYYILFQQLFLFWNPVFVLKHWQGSKPKLETTVTSNSNKVWMYILNICLRLLQHLSTFATFVIFVIFTTFVIFWSICDLWRPFVTICEILRPLATTVYDHLRQFATFVEFGTLYIWLTFLSRFLLSLLHCHIIHLTILERFSWSSLVYRYAQKWPKTAFIHLFIHSFFLCSLSTLSVTLITFILIVKWSI